MWNTYTPSTTSNSNANVTDSSPMSGALSSNTSPISTGPSTLPTSSSSTISTVIFRIETIITSNGQGVQTIYVTTTPTSSPEYTRPIHQSIILGCAIGIPIGTATILLSAILLLLYRHRHRDQGQKAALKEQGGESTDSPTAAFARPEENTLGPCTSETVQSPDYKKLELEASPSVGPTTLLPVYSPGVAGKELIQSTSGFEAYRPVYELPG